MPSPAQVRKEIARLEKDVALQRKKVSDTQAEAAKARAKAHDARALAARASSASTASYQLREAERAEKKASDVEKKAAEASKKVADLGVKLAARFKALEAAERDEHRRQALQNDRRRREELRHAREVARLAQPAGPFSQARILRPPKPEKLRVLYLAANPEMDLRVDVEVRAVRDAVRKALHRDLVEIDHRPAATPEDLLDGINEVRPHVIHFAGHAGGSGVLFDDAQIETADRSEGRGRLMSFELLGRALAATDTPPTLLVLNACDTLAGGETLLGMVPVLVGTESALSDPAAAAFAARFYAAIASAQSVAASLEQGRVSVDTTELGEGSKIHALARDDVDLGQLILVRPADS